jgi:phenylpropionate dioxygenase-like ring-hydroxylating dioxygenase large terminal subunit
MHDRSHAVLGRSLDHIPESPRFHQCWYPVALAGEVTAERILGIDFLGTRIIAYRDAANKPIVQEAWCPHLGADLSLGDCVEGTIRCPYHHWRFAPDGHCTDIPTGDKIPPGAKIFTFPTAEAWGLVWAFNGDAPLYDVPQIPDAKETDLHYSANTRGIGNFPHWIATSNGVDFQHLRSLHKIDAGAPDHLDVGEHSIEFSIDTERYLQHGRISGTNVFAQHLRVQGMHHFMLFTGAPVDARTSRGFFVVGIRKTEGQPAEAANGQLQGLKAFVQGLLEEDLPVLNTIRFRRGVMTASDRHLSRYFKYVSEYPLAAARP